MATIYRVLVTRPNRDKQYQALFYGDKKAVGPYDRCANTGEDGTNAAAMDFYKAAVKAAKQEGGEFTVRFIRTVETEVAVTHSIKPPVVTLCPLGHPIDHGRCTVCTYTVKG